MFCSCQNSLVVELLYAFAKVRDLSLQVEREQSKLTLNLWSEDFGRRELSDFVSDVCAMMEVMWFMCLEA